ncbi:MAG: hypothetical protein KAH07_00790 [Flavobacteriaceae bacterium]|nr:hypothetical protein [Flavobacteriaceae bacterium]
MKTRNFLLVSVIFLSAIANGQINEIGISLGGSNYIGDVGRETYIYPNSYAIGGIYKRNLNQRIALRGTYTYAELTDDDASSENIARQLRGYEFTNTLHEIAVGLEYSFFDYSFSCRDRNKRHTPYLLFEVAAINYKTAVSGTPGDYEYKSTTSFSIPFGLGYKTKIYKNLAGAIEIGMRYTFVDDLDYNNTDIPDLNFGNPNDNDWYVFSGINLVYTFGRPPCYSPLR